MNTTETVCKSRLKTSQQVGCVANYLIERIIKLATFVFFFLLLAACFDLD